MPTLYLVPTPLGNPDDITLRALRILREVSAIAVPQYAQQILKLLEDLEIPTKTIPYANALDALAAGDVALVADAGTPAMGGAAHEVVRAAIDTGVRVEPLPGASAEITALVLSGLPTDSFAYFDRLPDNLSALADERSTMIFTTHNVTEALIQMMAAFGDRGICIAARLTQPHEDVFRGTIRDALEYDRAQAVFDDIVLVVAGAPEKMAEVWDEARVRAELSDRMQAGEPLKLAAKAVAAAAGWDRRAVYALGVDEKRNTP